MKVAWPLQPSALKNTASLKPAIRKLGIFVAVCENSETNLCWRGEEK